MYAYTGNRYNFRISAQVILQIPKQLKWVLARGVCDKSTAQTAHFRQWESLRGLVDIPRMCLSWVLVRDVRFGRYKPMKRPNFCEISTFKFTKFQISTSLARGQTARSLRVYMFSFAVVICVFTSSGTCYSAVGTAFVSCRHICLIIMSHSVIFWFVSQINLIWFDIAVSPHCNPSSWHCICPWFLHA